MHCPFCAADDTKVIDSRLVADGDQVRRRRECLGCKERFTTYEVAELVMPRVIKQDGKREPFDENKLRAGFLRAARRSAAALLAVSAGVFTACQIGSADGSTAVADDPSATPAEGSAPPASANTSPPAP